MRAGPGGEMLRGVTHGFDLYLTGDPGDVMRPALAERGTERGEVVVLRSKALARFGPNGAVIGVGLGAPEQEVALLLQDLKALADRKLWRFGDARGEKKPDELFALWLAAREAAFMAADPAEPGALGRLGRMTAGDFVMWIVYGTAVAGAFWVLARMLGVLKEHPWGQ